MNSGQRITSLPMKQPPDSTQKPDNLARDVQQFVGEKMAAVMKPIDNLNLAVAEATLAFVRALPKFPAARLYGDLVLGWPHAHKPRPPTFGVPLPSLGPVICAGSLSVLINGLPTARVGDLGFGAWCGGLFPIFEVFTGSSHVFIGGSRPARQFIDFTHHCQEATPGMGKLGAAMFVFSAGMGALEVAASLTDMSNADARLAQAESEAEAAAAAAEATAAGVGAAVAAAQTAADAAAAALSACMGLDEAMPDGVVAVGNFITGSPNVLIGGFPMPGWMAILRGLGKLLKRGMRRVRRSRTKSDAGEVGTPNCKIG